MLQTTGPVPGAERNRWTLTFLDPELEREHHVVGAMRNTYFDAAVPAILREGGTITQFAGDAVMAIWNAPGRQADHAQRAARAALDMQRACEAIAAQAADRPRFRVGLATGPALAGNVGSADLRNFTAIGDTVNLTARLQTFAGRATS
jgi:class 3 adenylate cyclase